MSAIVETSNIGASPLFTAVNATSNLLATVNSRGSERVSSVLGVHENDHDTGWIPSANCPSNILHDDLFPGEECVALDWAHPQFGNILAVGTNKGRVLLITNRPSPDDILNPLWHLSCVLSGTERVDARYRVVDMAFAPADVGLILAVGHANGSVRLYSCSKPGIAHQSTSWPMQHTVQLPSGNDVSLQEGQKGCTCVTVCWQPQASVQQPFFAAATESSVSIWCYDQSAAGWVVVCTDVEKSCGNRREGKPVSCISWAPLMGRASECIAVSQGRTVRLFSLKGNLTHSNGGENLQAEQIGDAVQHEADVCKLQWNHLGLALGVSCVRSPSSPPSVFVYNINILGKLDPQPVMTIHGDR